ncbi:MAG: 30S ribosomal protein S19 [Phycisphaerales bacterium]|nr:30S ribosomal protein S19 [Phycisphaerales bacterium]
MSRSLKKGPYVDEVLYERVMRAKQTGSAAAHKTWNRACTIVPEFVGQKFDVHNGKTFHQVYVTEDMVGHKLGEFSPTRNFRGHTAREVKK